MMRLSAACCVHPSFSPPPPCHIAPIVVCISVWLADWLTGWLAGSLAHSLVPPAMLRARVCACVCVVASGRAAPLAVGASRASHRRCLCFLSVLCLLCFALLACLFACLHACVLLARSRARRSPSTWAVLPRLSSITESWLHGYLECKARHSPKGEEAQDMEKGNEKNRESGQGGRRRGGEESKQAGRRDGRRQAHKVILPEDASACAVCCSLSLSGQAGR